MWKRIKILLTVEVVACLATMGIMVAALLFVYWQPLSARVRFEMGIGAISSGHDFRDVLRRHAGDGDYRWHISTFEEEAESADVERLYLKACMRARARWGAHTEQDTYHWTWASYPVLSTVFQGEDDFLEVNVYEGNDSDGASIRVARGHFINWLTREARVDEHSGVTRRGDHLLPDGMLRCNWQQQ